MACIPVWAPALSSLPSRHGLASFSVLSSSSSPSFPVSLSATGPSSPTQGKCSKSLGIMAPAGVWSGSIFRPRRGQHGARCAVAKSATPQTGTDQFLVFVPPHPLIKHWISVLRNEYTPSPMFRNALAELGRLLIYEASRDWLVTVTGEIQTPLGVANVEFIDPREPVKVVPILRAGLVLAELISSVLPSTQTYHLGYARDEVTLQPTCYLNKLPGTFSEGSRVLITDPMLATGGTMVAAIDELKSRGVDHKLIRVISAVAAPPALTKLSEKFPGLRVYTGAIDPELNDQGYILPGLGDAGDRSFGT